MSAGKVGRNDPCPCGSGKKYKYCCLRKDQARRRRQRRVTPSSPERARSAGGVLQQIGRLRQRLRSNLPDDEARELDEQMGTIESLVAYAAMGDEITDAMETLEEYRGDFESMMADPESAMERALRLCSEERFDDIRITPEELNAAFEAVGYPELGPHGLTDHDLEVMVRAAIHLTGDEEHRLTLSRQLMIAVPEYVAADRYRDAWLLQYSAYRLVEEPEESNPFMFGMVELAFEAWTEQIQGEHESLLAELGVDRGELDGATFDDGLALAQDMAADSEMIARLERFYEARPGMRARAEREVRVLESEAALLLEREDARCLLPSHSETMPWIQAFMESTTSLQARARREMEAGEEPDAELAADAREALMAVVEEMGTAIYTPERVDQLVADLKDYRRKLKAAGEEQAVRQVDSALVVTASGTRPGQSAFLLATCFVGLRTALQDIAEGRREA